MTNTVRLLVDGVEFAGWKRVSITAGIDRQAREFDLAITDRWPGSMDVPRRIWLGNECVVMVGGDKVLTGHVDATPIAYDAKSITVGVRGRSRTADMVDCAALDKPGHWKGRKVEQILRELGGQYGVEIVVQTDTGSVVADHKVEQGESAFECADRLLKLRSLLSTDDAEGRLVITRAGTTRAATDLVVGSNILGGSTNLDVKDRYSEVVVKGRRSGNDLDFADQVAHAEGESADPGVKRRRRLVIVAQGQADTATCRDRARWEAAYRAGKSYQATYTVHGWRQGNGALWQPNMMVHVVDPIIGWDMDMMIGEVTWSLSSEGTIATLTVAPKAAWELLASLPKAKGKGGLDLRPGETMVEF